MGILTGVVTNNGTITAHNVTVTDTLPATLSLSSVTASVGSCSNTGNAITCSLGTIPPGESSTILIKYGALTPDSVTDTISVSATEPDPNPANNTMSLPSQPQYLLPVYDHTDPPSVIAGSPGISLSLYGGNFVAGITTVTFNGTPLQVTGLTTITTPGHNFSSTGCNTRTSAQTGTCQQLTVSVPANLLTTSGTPNIIVTNPQPGGGTFNTPDRPFTIISGPCSYTVSPNTTQHVGNGNPPGGITYFSGAGGVLSFNVTANPSTCTWGNSANVPWLVPENPGDFEGNSFLNFEYLPNAGAARTGTITIAGQQITVNQDGGLGCYLNVSGSSEDFPLAGGAGQVGIVETAPQCLEWTAAADVGWVTVTSGASLGVLNTTGNSANAIIAYSVAANSGAARTGHINVSSGGNVVATFTVNQAGTGTACTFTLTGNPASPAAAGGTASFSVTDSDPTCTWTAVSNSPFVTITGGASGTGSGTVNYSVGANTGAARSGTITAAGQTFTINQAAGASSGTPALFGIIASKAGPQNARVWTFTIGNSGSGTATAAQISGVLFTQTFLGGGAACTPSITSPASFPLALGDIAAGSTTTGSVTINFNGCADAARFTVLAGLTSNSGAAVGSIAQ